MSGSKYSAATVGTTRALIAAMLAVLVLLLTLAWQAGRSIRAHDEMAMSVLADYAELAADEFSRRSMAAIGYYGYYQTMTSLRDAVANDAGFAGDWVPADYVFHIRSDSLELQLAGRGDMSVLERIHIGETLLPHATTPLPDSGLLISHAVPEARQYSFVISWPTDGTALYGFLVSREWLTRTLADAFSDKPLLPESLAAGAVTNDLLFVELRDTAGDVLFESGQRSGNSPVAVIQLTDEYDGVLRGHMITVAIDVALADALVIGGLPKNRLPMVAAIIFLAVALLVASIWQLRRAQALSRMRSNFVAEVSHELRTPLTQIRMFTESLLLGRMQTEDDRQRSLRIVNREAGRMIHLVENILQFSEGGQSQSGIDIRHQRLAPIVTSVVDEFQVLADASDSTISATIDEDVEATVDADALRQILLNLLDNAVKYGPSGQTVTVEVRARSGAVHLSVGDEGPGIPANERRRIWQGFHRLEREQGSAVAGAGIGLAVVQNLVQLHGGTVRVEDNTDGGARFVVEIPA